MSELEILMGISQGSIFGYLSYLWIIQQLSGYKLHWGHWSFDIPRQT